VSEYQFDLSGGSPPIDFANTLGGKHRREERLVGYADLVAFARQAGLLSDELAARLSAAAVARPAEAEAVLARARELREALFALFSEAERPAMALDELNDELAVAMAQLRVDPALAWTWADEAERLDSPLWPIARQAAELLVTEQRRRVHECAADDCRWLFLDTSKNRSRRWCDMKSCGNRAKVRSFYERQRAGA
jgi:predicted RNA-binding Zn ribbon-like protein